MGKNGHYTLESAWNEISKVKNAYNQQKLVELYQKAAPFIEKYQDTDVKTLFTPEFAMDYLPVLRLILKQSAGKKLLLSFIANPWVGVTRSVTWFIWLPTKIGSQAAMTILKSYETELEKQAAGNTVDQSTQTDPSPPDAILVPPVEPTDDPILVQPVEMIEPEQILVPDQNDMPIDPEIDQNGSNNNSTNSVDNNVTSGIGCDALEWSASDGETEEIMARFVNTSKIADETPHKPQMNSTLPHVTPRPTSPKPPSEPRKLTKGSRKSSLKDSGLNLLCAWEDSRKDAAVDEPASAIMEDFEEDVTEIDLTDAEIAALENGVDDVFNSSGDSFVEIPDLE